MNQMIQKAWFESVPKVELHLHLEGAIPHDALWKLVKKYGGDPSLPHIEALKQRFEYRDFPHFIETWVWKNQFLREYEDFTFIAEQVAHDLVRQNIRYAETFYSPADFARHQLTPQEITIAIRKGLSRVPNVKIVLVADMVRDFGPDNALETLSRITEVKDMGVVGIGIGGSEQAYPPEPFKAVFEKARKLGFQTTAHAGEAAGSVSIWGAIRHLQVDRIGHGTRAEEDDALLDYLAEKHIPLEMCPTSNVLTGVVNTFKEHPVRRYMDRGIPLSINTDDPKMFGNTLAGEYRQLEEKLNFSRDEIRTLILQGIEHSWLPQEKKQQLAAEFRQDLNWNNK